MWLFVARNSQAPGSGSLDVSGSFAGLLGGSAGPAKSLKSCG